MRAWQVQEAKARFSKFLEASLKEGPQIVTRRGVKVAVLVPVDEWRRLQKGAGRSKDLLLADEARFDDLVPPRGQRRCRPAPVFE